MAAAKPGGVVERLMAPVLKTGRAKALVGSNPTPSAIALDPRSSLFALQQPALRHEEAARNSNHHPSDDIGEKVSQQVDARYADNDWNKQERRSEATPKDKQRREKCEAGGGMTRRKRMEFGCQ